MERTGQYLGYQAMQRKLREQHEVAVPRNLVYDAIGLVVKEGLRRRRHCWSQEKMRKSHWNHYITVNIFRIFSLLMCIVKYFY